YRDVRAEYPPLAFVPILTAFYISDTLGGFFDGFEAVFAIEMYLLALAGGMTAWSIGRRVMPAAHERELGRRLVVYVAGFLLLGQVVTTRFDLVPAVLMAGALACWLRRREGFGWALLAAGVATKLFPVVLAPLFAIDLLARRGWLAALRGGLIFLGWCVVGFLPGLLASPDGLREALTYHSERGTQIEGAWANSLLILNHLTGLQVGTDNVFGAFEAISSWTDELKVISVLAQVVALGVVYLTFAWLAGQARSETEWARSLLLASLLALAAFIIFGKVFSPQYLIWLMPLAVVVPGRHGRWALVLFLGTLALSQAIFPYAYDALRDRTGPAVLLLTARNLTFIAFAAVVAIAYRRTFTHDLRR
ncbi:MAG: glycosyltransferase 87 family protein, partial [Vicinamibacterales bacterium]